MYCAFRFALYLLMFLNQHNITVANSNSPSTSCNESYTSEVSAFRGSCRQPSVAITVSALPTKYLQLSWIVENYTDGDWVGMFNKNPSCQEDNATLLYKILIVNNTGFADTNIQETPKSSSDLGFKSHCLSYWVAYLTSNSTVITSTCLKTNPTWMYDARDYLRNMQLKKMFIPGTHDSGAYISYNDVLNNQGIVERYIFTQDDDILNQLIYGVRYLDLRVSSYFHTTAERWWINHGVYRVHQLKDIIGGIKKFLQNTKEIIIIDIHEFPVGFEESFETHRELVGYLKSELSEWIAPPNWSVTCGQLWAKNKTLIISYNNRKVVKEFTSILWPAVSQKWANVQNIELLKQYLTNVIERRPVHSWAAMAQLTPTAWSILTYKSKGLREMANTINPSVTNWFKGSWGRTCNIVAVDFVRNTDIINTAIQWNIRRARKSSCDYS